MAEKIRDPEFRHPELAAFLQGLTDEQAATPGPLSVERGGVASHYWRDDGRVHCREFKAASGGPSSEMEALHAEIAAAVGRSLPRMRAELLGGGVPDLDAIDDVDPRRPAGRRGEVLHCSRRSTPLFRPRPARVATGGWTVTAGSGRRSGRASDRSVSNGAVSAAASAAAAVSLWTRRRIWKARTSRPVRKASMRTPPVPTAAGRRAAS